VCCVLGDCSPTEYVAGEVDADATRYPPIVPNALFLVWVFERFLTWPWEGEPNTPEGLSGLSKLPPGVGGGGSGGVSVSSLERLPSYYLSVWMITWE
jgi:hypothetical protein